MRHLAVWCLSLCCQTARKWRWSPWSCTHCISTDDPTDWKANQELAVKGILQDIKALWSTCTGNTAGWHHNGHAHPVSRVLLEVQRESVAKWVQCPAPSSSCGSVEVQAECHLQSRLWSMVGGASHFGDAWVLLVVVTPRKAHRDVPRGHGSVGRAAITQLEGCRFERSHSNELLVQFKQIIENWCMEKRQELCVICLSNFFYKLLLCLSAKYLFHV